MLLFINYSYLLELISQNLYNSFSYLNSESKYYINLLYNYKNIKIKWSFRSMCKSTLNIV